MKRLLAILALAFAGCDTSSPPANPLPSTQLGQKVELVQSEVNDQIAGNVAGIKKTAANLPPGSREREVIGIFSDNILRLTGAATLETQTEFESLAGKLLSPDARARAEAERQLQSKQTELDALRNTLTTAKAEHAAALTRERSEWQAKVDAARAEGEAKIRTLQTWIFYGGGALLIALGAASFFLAAQVPFLGPKVSIGIAGAGAALIAAGKVLAELEKHPWIFYTGLGLAVAALAVAVGLAVSNQHHANETPAGG